MKTVEEVAAMVDGASVFSVCDASSGFWQIRLREDCTNLTVFNTPFGRYKFLRIWRVCSHRRRHISKGY